MSFRIGFGTDGWRGRIAEEYTFTNVRRCAQGFANYLAEKGYQGEKVVVGYDNRFHSENFASAVAEVLAGNGLEVFLTNGATPYSGDILFDSGQGCGRGGEYHSLP